MTAENFVYWLQGMLEISNPETITKEQIQVIKDHIALVLRKETPNRTQPLPLPDNRWINTNRNDDIVLHSFKPKGLQYVNIWDFGQQLYPKAEEKYVDFESLYTNVACSC